MQFYLLFLIQMQQGEVKQTDLVDYEQLEEAQSQNHSKYLNPQPAQKSQANGSFLFQLDSPKQKISQVMNVQNEGLAHKPTQNKQIEANAKTQQNPFSYQLDLTSQQNEAQRQNNEQTQKIKRQHQAKKYRTANHDQMVGTKSSKQVDQVSQDNREDRMNRRKKKSTFKDILNSSQHKHQNNKAGESTQNKNQLKNVEYAKTQQHSYVPQIEDQRTDIPLKQDPLTAAERIQGLRDQNPKELRQTKQLPPLKKQRTKKQQQSFLNNNNDNSLMALDKVTDIKEKSESLAPSCHQQGVFKHFAFKSIPVGSKIKFLFKRQKNCMQNYYHPEYSLVFNLNKHIFSARKDWGHINSHYNISCEEKNYAKTGNYYAGYLKGNFTGTCFNLFSFNDLAAQLVATIIYRAELSCIQQSYRQFEVYIKNNHYAYSQLAGYRQGSTIDLQELYEVSDNARARKIIKLVNKRAEWSQSMGAFVMNFRGKLKIPSVKNMILVQQGNQRHYVLMLCKQSQNEFYMQTANPLDPFLAMGIVLSSFDFKLFCQ